MKRIPFFVGFVLFFGSSWSVPKKSTPDTLFHNEYRKKAIKKLLKHYTRPITILFIGPITQASLPFSIADKFESVCIVVDEDATDSLLAQCKDEQPKNMILLKRNISLKELRRLGECEHFDVVIALDTFKLYQAEWYEAFTYLRQLGEYLFLEVPHNKDFCDYVNQQGAALIHSSNTQMLYLCSTPKHFLKRRRWNYLMHSRPGEYSITSTFHEKKMVKKSKTHGPDTQTPWHAGINLLTFKTLKGAYPLRATIRSLVEPFRLIQHNDLKIFNIIIQGKKLIPIDCNEPGRDNDPKEEVDTILHYFRGHVCNYQQLVEELQEACLEADEEDEQ